MDFTLRTRVSGPVFDGRAKRAASAYLEQSKQDVADIAVNDVVNELKRVIRDPTPRYWTRIRTNRQRDDVMVTDGGIIYGPWLEGTGSRNRTTRFKGYATFRRVRQRLQRKADSIMQKALPPYIKRMNR